MGELTKLIWDLSGYLACSMIFELFTMEYSVYSVNGTRVIGAKNVVY